MSRFLLAVTMFLRDADAVADGLGEEMAGCAAGSSPAVRAASSSAVKSLHSENGLPSAISSAQPDCRKRSRSSASGNSMRTCATCGFCSRSACSSVGGFGDQQDADVEARQFRRRGPLQERDQVHPFLDAGIGLLAGGDQLLGKIDDQRDALPLRVRPRRLAGRTGVSSGARREEIPRRALLVEVRVLDVVDRLPATRRSASAFPASRRSGRRGCRRTAGRRAPGNSRRTRKVFSGT